MAIVEDRQTGGRGATALEVQVGMLEVLVEEQGRQIAQLRDALRVMASAMFAAATAEAMIDQLIDST